MLLTCLGLLGSSREGLNQVNFRQIKPMTYQDHIYGAVLGAASSLGTSDANDRADLKTLDALTQGWQFLNQENFSYHAIAQVYGNFNKNLLNDRPISDLLLEAWPTGLVMVWPYSSFDQIEKLLLLAMPADKKTDLDLCAARFAIAVGMKYSLCPDQGFTPTGVVDRMIKAARGPSSKLAKLMKLAQYKGACDIYLNLSDLKGVNGVMLAVVYIYMKHFANLPKALELCDLIKDDETRYVVKALVGSLVGAYCGINRFCDFQELTNLTQKDYLFDLSQNIYQKHVARIGRYVEGFA